MKVKVTATRLMKYLSLVAMTMVAVTVVSVTFVHPVFATPSTIAVQHTGIAVAMVNGLLVSEGHNTYTNQGKNMTMNALNGVSTSVQTIAVGNTTIPTATDTILAGQLAVGGITPVAGTYTFNPTTGNWSVSYQWTNTGSAIAVNTTMLYNGTATGNHTFAGNSFTTVTLQTNDKLNVTWYIWTA